MSIWVRILNFLILVIIIKIKGKLFFQFIIEKDGSVSNVHPYKEEEEEEEETCKINVIEVIKNMPDWVPGEHNGNRIRVQYALPMSISLR